MEEILLYYLLRAIGACSAKTFRRVDAPDNMVAVHVDMEFIFERHEIKFIERYVKEQWPEDGYLENVLKMCEDMHEYLKK